MVAAVQKLEAMSLAQKEQLVEVICRDQPAMLASVVVQKQMGVAIEKIEFLLELLLVCFLAMKESTLDWPAITEDDQDRQMRRYVATVKFGRDLGKSLQSQATKQYVLNHPEKPLLAFTVDRIVRWLVHIRAEETDKYVILAAINFVNCIATCAMPKTKL